MSNHALDSRAFHNTSTPVFVRVLKEIFRATPLYLFVAGLQAKPGKGR